MEIYLVRHAIAHERDASRWPDDALRPLTDEGVERFESAARGLRRIVPAVECVLTSPFTRAWQTAEILTSHAGWPAAERADELTAGGDPDAVVTLLERRTVESVALVGHEPDLSGLASLLLVGDAAKAEIELKKGGVIALTAWTADVRAATFLRWLAQPKLLRMLDPSR
jgi:phosphohistidine phosphatase